MISEKQHTEIRDFLLEKKLPLDLLIEVEDHFISQINDLQLQKKLSFDDAFSAVIIAWHSDLKLSWDGNWSLEDTSVLIKKSTRQKVSVIIKKSLWIAVIAHALVLVAYHIITFYIFRIIFGACVCLVMFFPLGVYLKEKKYFDLPGKYKHIRISAYQDLVSVFFILPVSMGWLIRFVFEIEDGFLDFNSWKGIGLNFLFIFFFFFEAKLIISQQKYLVMIKKIIPYLKENFKVSE